MTRSSLTASIRVVVAVVAACLALSCTRKNGEVILVVNTDMALTHDIDHLEVQVFANGQPRNNGNVLSFAPPRDSESLLVPATLGIGSGHDSSQVAQIKVAAFQKNVVRVLREVDLTVPDDQVLELPLAVDWLCTDSVMTDASDPLNVSFVDTTCGKGKTCVAGRCVDPKVNSTKLHPYVPASVFGGGTGKGDGVCFDTLRCFDAPSLVAPDADCTIDEPDGTVNVALLVDGDGIRNDSMPAGRGFIPLDSESAEGWQTLRGTNRIQLPAAVCSGPKKPLIRAIAVTTSCKTSKTAATPTCGPWSSVGDGSVGNDITVELPDASIGTSLDASVPDIIGDGGCPMSCNGSCASGRCATPVESAQENPFGIVIDGDYVYWTDIGTSVDGTGSVKRKLVHAADAGAVDTLAASQNSPAGIIVAGGFVYWANEGTSLDYADGAILRAPLGAGDAGAIQIIASNESRPNAIAVDGANVYWVSEGTRAGAYLDGSVRKAPIEGLEGGVPTVLASGLLDPTSLAVDATSVYFTTQGTRTAAFSDGAVSKVPIGGGDVVPLGPPQIGAQGLALYDGTLYFASSNDNAGKIVSIAVDGSALTTLASGENLPEFVATDGKYVYWTTVSGSVKKVGVGGGAVTTLATDQMLPSGIAVDATSCFWTTSGTNGANGTVTAVTPK
ncbi:MAG TPA: hypothetical protein VH062_34790 [Polyangiaceae bacterium]|nr:hypothetical protein [Polyangiaceae bacterium]